jgi:hypothetical protein
MSVFPRRVMKVAAAAGLLLSPVAVIAYPMIHNHHVAPLGRLAKRVHPGDDCGATARSFAAYFERQRARGNGDVQYADSRTGDTPGSRLAPSGRLLHLYDLTVFDDVQLTAICDTQGRRVERIIFLGD